MGYIRKKVNYKMGRNVIIFLALVFITYFFIFKDQDFNELGKTLSSVNPLFILLGFLLMLVYFLIESFNVKSVLKSLGENISIFSALRYTFIGFFFSAITPAATGGQPIEAYYMVKDKISGGNATMSLLIQLCGFQISTILLGLTCAFLYPELLNGALLWFFIIGIILNGFALAVMLSFIFSRKLTEKITNKILDILTFFKAKNIDLRREAAFETIEKYKEGYTFIKSHKDIFIKSVLRVFIQILVYYSVTYCVYRAFGLDSYSIFQIIPMQAVLYTIVSGLPLPGAVGVSETAFLVIFGSVFGTAVRGAMLVYRGISFYLFLIISLIVVITTAKKKKSIKSEIDERALAFEEKIRELNKSNIAI